MCELKSTIQTITLAANEVLVVRSEGYLTAEETAHVRDALERVMPSGARLMVISGDVTLSKITVEGGA